MNTERQDPRKNSWTVSPAFRSGPRQTSHDSNAREIIHFVRECQRPDLKQAGASCVKRKAVLPAIKCQQDNYCNKNLDFQVSDKTVEMTISELSSEIYNESISNSNYEQELLFFNEKGSNEILNIHRNELSNSPPLDSLKSIGEPVVIEENVNLKCENANNKNYYRTLYSQNTVPENELPVPLHQMICKYLDKGPETINSASMVSSNYLKKAGSVGQKSRQLPRPRILPQLPPREDLPQRPPAPSPTSDDIVQHLP